MVFSRLGFGKKHSDKSSSSALSSAAAPVGEAPKDQAEAQSAPPNGASNGSAIEHAKADHADATPDPQASVSKPNWFQHYPEGAAREIDPSAYHSVVDMIDEAIAKFADKPAIVLGDQVHSFAEIGGFSQRFATFLRQEIGLQKGDRVAAMMPNLPAFPITLFGVWKAGGIQVNINPMYTPTELRHQLVDSGATVLVIADVVLPTFNAIASATSVKSVIVINTGAQVEPPQNVKVVNFLEALAHEHEDLPPVLLGPDDVAALQYTGGTTGVSKGATLTHRNLVANIMQCETVLRAVVDGDDETILTALPLYHIFALTVNLLLHFHFGAKNVFVPNPRDLDAFAAAFKTNTVTVLTGVNTLFQGLTTAPQFAEIDFSTVKLALGGGSAVQEVISNRWRERAGRHILEGYGLSETAPVLTINNPSGESFSGAVGVPAPSTDISIRDDDGNELPLGESGEICAKGPQVMKGYWNRPEATAACMTADGFFRTGDIGYMDDQGFIYINDRKKDMINVSGFNVYPNEVEGVVAMMDAVFECAVVGVPDEKTGEAVRVFAVADPDLKAEEVIAHCREYLAAYKVPKQVIFLDDLPKSSVGKILRRELRDYQGA